MEKDWANWVISEPSMSLEYWVNSSGSRDSMLMTELAWKLPSHRFSETNLLEPSLLFQGIRGALFSFGRVGGGHVVSEHCLVK